jgi:hypothetical protein
MQKPFYAAEPVNERRTLLTGPIPAHFGVAIAAALKDLQRDLTGKNLSDYFDGREGKSVAESTISKWIAEPHRFPAVMLPVLATLHPGFRSQLFQLLGAAFSVPAEIARELSPEASAEYQRILEKKFLDAVYGPGRAGMWEGIGR